MDLYILLPVTLVRTRVYSYFTSQQHACTLRSGWTTHKCMPNKLFLPNATQLQPHQLIAPTLHPSQKTPIFSLLKADNQILGWSAIILWEGFSMGMPP